MPKQQTHKLNFQTYLFSMKKHIKNVILAWLEINNLQVRDEYVDALAATLHVAMYSYYNETEANKRLWSKGDDKKRES
jgi:hypothetical protein